MVRIAVFVLAVALSSLQAMAGDIYSRGSIKDTSAEIAAPESNPFAGLYVGGEVGAETNDITLSLGEAGTFSGISADGFRTGVYGGYTLCGPVICAGAEAAYGLADANVEFGPYGDLLEAEDYLKAVATLKARFGNAYVGIRGGYEWQTWTAGNSQIGGELDVDTGWWVVGAEVGVMPLAGGVVRLAADYAMLDAIEVDGASGAGNDEITKALEDTDKLTIMLGVHYQVGFGRSLTGLVD